MGHQFDIDYGQSGMNSDAENRAMPPSDYRFALNVRNGANYAGLEGTNTNVMGNLPVTTILCPYTDYEGLPSGINVTLGSFEDVINNTIIFFNWNSNNQHGIYRLYPNLNDAANPYGVVQQLIQYNFGWGQSDRITSVNYVPSENGDLCTWIDNTGLREINLAKANVVNRSKSWVIYTGQSFVFGATALFQLRLLDFNGNPVFQGGINITAGQFTNNTDAMAYIANTINQSPTYSLLIKATACKCSLTITEVGTNGWTLTCTGYNNLLAASGWYGTMLDDSLFSRATMMPLNAPQVSYQADSSYKPNNLLGKVFQFREAYLTSDFEYSCYGVYSQIAVNNLLCDGTQNQLLNYIQVNFNDPYLLNPVSYVRLEKVRFVARELNTGSDQWVLDLEPCDFLDLNTNTCYYNFYNDIISTTVDTQDASTLEPGVPITGNCEVFYFNRMVTIGATLGRDAPDCPTGKFLMTMGADPNPPLYPVTFYVRVQSWGLEFQQAAGQGFPNVYPTLSQAPFWQDSLPATNYVIQRGIIGDNGASPDAGPYFGCAFGYVDPGAGTSFGIVTGIDTTLYDQRLPQAGWAFYSAGTPYFSISKQIDLPLHQNPNGSLITAQNTDKDTIGTYLRQTSNNDIYSMVTIMLPAGEHVIRAASHWCSFGDVLGKGYVYDLNGSDWQKTSTNVWGVYVGGGGNEAMFTPANFRYAKELKITVNGPIADAGTFVIADLAPPWYLSSEQLGDWGIFNCYLYDSSNGATVDLNPNDIQFNGVSVEKTCINFPPTNPDIGTPPFWQNFSFTDHNGYFFFTGTNQPLIYAIQIGANPLPPALIIGNGTIIANGDEAVFVGSLTDYYNKTLRLTPLPTTGQANGLLAGIITTSSATARTTCSMIISGQVTDQNNNPIKGALSVYTNGSFNKTDINGNYKLVAWGDVLTPNISNLQAANTTFSNQTGRTVDILVLSAPPLCNVTYPSGQEVGPLNINPINANAGTTPPPYSPTAMFPVAVFVINETNNPVTKAHKRGGNYIYPIRCYDTYGRLCAPVQAFQMYVPFETEDLSTYDYVVNNFTAKLPFTVSTFISGIPSIQWDLSALQVPQYAAYVQLMRSTNMIYDTQNGTILQWVANQVTYIAQLANGDSPEVDTSYQNGNAVAIKISIANIVTYGQQNPASQVGYVFNNQDRLRIIYDRFGNLIQGLQDYQITSYDSTTQSIYINAQDNLTQIFSGTTIEIYTRLSVEAIDEQTFYEVGEVIPCTTPGVAGNALAFTTGIFTNGDTYWRGTLVPVSDPLTLFTAAYPLIGEWPTVSNFYPSLAQDIGRIGIIDPNEKQIFYPALATVSQQFQNGSAFNGLNLYFATDEVDLGAQYGEAQRVIMIGKVLHAIMKSNNISNYIGVVTLQYAQETDGVQATAASFMGTENPSLAALGTDFPASVSTIDGYIYMLYSLRKCVSRFAQDGNTQISRNEYTAQNPDGSTSVHTRMLNYFKQLCAPGIWDAVAIFDKRYAEYILTVWQQATSAGVFVQSQQPHITVQGQIMGLNYAGQEMEITYTSSNGSVNTITVTITSVQTVSSPVVTNIYFTPILPIANNTSVQINYKGQGSTISWNEESDRWKTTYPFVPDCYGSLGDVIYSFINGQPWVHDVNPIRNNFYGVQYTMQIQPVFNKQPLLLKVWNSNILRTQQDNGANNWQALSITNDNGQQSVLPQGNWTQIGENWYAAFLRDTTDQTVDPSIVLSNGRALRSTSLVCLLDNNYTGLVRLYSWDANFSLSERTSR